MDDDVGLLRWIRSEADGCFGGLDRVHGVSGLGALHLLGVLGVLGVKGRLVEKGSGLGGLLWDIGVAVGEEGLLQVQSVICMQLGDWEHTFGRTADCLMGGAM
jgi:hypothetical protein